MNQKSANFGRERRVKFGLYLRDLRKDRGLSQKQVAGELRINLSDMERGGRSASIDQLIRLAKKYDVPLEQLLRKKYQPQLPLLTGVMDPTELVDDLQKELRPDEWEEVTSYMAFLLLRRAAANRS